jgi:TonB family protein
MNTIQNIVTGSAAQVLGWALMHLLWQGLLIAILLKILLRGVPVRLAGLRYWIASTALMAMLWMPGISVWKAFSARPAAVTIPEPAAPLAERSASVPQVAAPGAIPARVDAIGDWRRLVPERLGALVPWLSMVWFAGTVLFASVVLGGLFRAQFLMRNAKFVTGDGWAHRLESLTLDSRAREPVRLLESVRIRVPTVIGWLHPAILLPAGAAHELATEHLDALLAHELAHIRRRDYLVNLLQTFIEVLLWYHPATWWVTMQVRTERECCCDDEAVAVCGDPLTYARALSRAERLRSASNWAIALSGASLLNRVRRLTEMKTPQIGRVAVYLMGLFAIGLILAAGAASSLLAYMPAVVERPSVAATTPAMPQVMQRESPKPVSAAPNSQGAVQNKTVNKVPSQEKFVRPTEIPREIKPEQWLDLQKLEALLTAKRQQLEELKIRFNKTHPDVVMLSRLIADLEMQMARLRRGAPLQQATLGPKLTGYVYDPTGAVVPGVSISAGIPGNRQVLASTHSDVQGYFEIDSFTGVDFELRFEIAGFAPQVLAPRNLGTGPLGVTLELGQVTETVTIITGAGPGAAASAARNPVRVGGTIVQPKVILRVDPIYPPQAKIDNIEGTVVVSALIDEEGRVKDAIVVSGHSMLRDAALESVCQWRYTPVLLNGEPWPMRLSITLVFKLAR